MRVVVLLRDRKAPAYRRVWLYGVGRVLLACIYQAIAIVGVVAQQTQQPSSPVPESPEHPAAVRVTTKLVQVNVIVNDKHGNPLTGLSKEDFVLLDNKQPQDIRVFSVDTNSPIAGPSAPLPPDTYSNRLTEGGNVPPSVTLILLDALNTESADQALTRKQVLKFTAEMRPQDRIALYWLGNNLYALHDFTTDAGSLREALMRSASESSRDLSESDAGYLTLNNPNPSLPSGIAAGQSSGREAFRSAFDTRVANESVKNRVRLTAAALIAIAHHVRSLAGRKNLVWVSGSFPFSLGQERFDLNFASQTGGTRFSAEIERAARALTDANVAIYPVDARGLMGSGVTAAGDDSESSPPEFSAENNERLPSRVAPDNLKTMKVLAERTGGKAFYGSNDLSQAIRRAIDDSRVTYTLGFYPAGANWDGRFHTIRVTAKTPGAHVRARTGYFALPDSGNTPPKSLEELISQTAISQLDATAIGLRAHVQLAGAAGERALDVNLHVDLRNIHMEQRNGAWISGLQTVFLELDSGGRILEGTDETLQLKLPQEAHDQALKDGLKNTKRIRIPAGASEMCIVLRDLANGNLGSLSIPIEKYLPSVFVKPAR
jgi:VWFA-related protein